MKYLIFNQFNLIKIFCCFLVVYQHIVSHFLNSPNATISTHLIYGSLLNFSRFAVPIFLLITGFLIMRSYENISLKDFYTKKVPRILKIYLCANLLFIIPKIFKSNYSINIFLRDIFLGKASSHLWYMNTLLKIYLFYPLFKILVIKLNKYFKCKSIVIITIMQYFINSNAYSILSKKQSNIGIFLFTYLDRSLIIWGYYIILGGLIYKNFDYIYKLIKRYKILCIILYIISLIYINLYTFNSATINYYKTSPSTFRILIYSILSFINLYYIADYLTKKNIKQIQTIEKAFSKHILKIYITHPLIVTASSNILFLVRPLPHNLGALIIILIVMILSIMPFYIYECKRQAVKI